MLKGLDRFEGQSSLRTWTFRILVNIAKSRGVKEHRTLPWSTLAGEDVGPSLDPAVFRSARASGRSMRFMTERKARRGQS